MIVACSMPEALAAFVDVNDDIITQAADQALRHWEQ